MSQALVAQIKAELVANGQTFTTNEDAFEITRRVAWALREQGAMLIGKRANQNGAVFQGRKYSHDALAFLTGWIDLLERAGPPDNLNRPVWNATGTDPTAALYSPIDPNTAPAPVPPVPVPAPPPIPPPDDLQARVLQLEAEMRAAEAIQRDLYRWIATKVNEPLPDYEGQGRVGWFGGSFTVRSKPVR